MWTKTEKPIPFFLKPDNSMLIEPEMSFSDENGNFCHIVEEGDGWSCMHTIGGDVEKRKEFVKHKRAEIWPAEVVAAYIDQQIEESVVVEDLQIENTELKSELQSAMERLSELFMGDCK